MNEGKKFEEDFKKSMDKYNIWNYRLRDSSGSWSNNKGSRFTPKNISVKSAPFKFTVVKSVPLKSTQFNFV